MKAFDKQISDKASLFPVSTHATAIVGSIGVGKTTVLLNLLLLGGWCRYYNRIILVSPTAMLDSKLRNLTEAMVVKTNIPLEKQIEEDELSLQDEPRQPTIFPKYKKIEENDIHTEYDHSIIADLVKWQKEVIAEYGEDLCDRVLLVLDDAIQLGCFDLKRKNLLTRSITECRHTKISVVMLSQYFKSIPPVVRTCLTALFFPECNKTEKEHIFSTFHLNMPFHKWDEYTSVICHKEHTFCQINKLNPRGFKLIKSDKEFIRQRIT